VYCYLYYSEDLLMCTSGASIFLRRTLSYRLVWGSACAFLPSCISVWAQGA